MADLVVLCADECMRDAVAYWFSAAPVRTLVAADGYVANRILKDVTSGLLVTDRLLPPWPGLDTFRQLRRDKPELGIAFIDDGTPDARSLARISGATAVLNRPLTRQAVVGAFGRPELVS